MGKTIATPPGICVFPHVFEPHRFPQEKEAKYSCSVIFDDGDDLSKLEKAAREAEFSRWPDGRPNIKFHDLIQSWKDGRRKIRAKTKASYDIKIYDRHDNLLTADNSDEIYSGAIIKLGIKIYAWDVQGQGISAHLIMVKKIADGEPLDVGENASDVFGVESDDDGDDGDIF